MHLDLVAPEGNLIQIKQKCQLFPSQCGKVIDFGSKLKSKTVVFLGKSAQFPK